VAAQAVPDHLLAARFNLAVLCSGHPTTYYLLLILLSLKGWKPELRLSAPGIEPERPAQIREHASERLMPDAS